MNKKLLAQALLLSCLLVPAAVIANASTPVIDFQLVTTIGGKPVGIVNAGDGSDRLFILTQIGVIRIYPNQPTPFLDLRGKVRSGGEAGLLGMVFHPNYTENGFFYVTYSDLDNNAVLSRFKVSESDPNVADPSSELVLLKSHNLSDIHYAGQLQFGPDGYLYVSRGDGSGGGDPGNRAQDLGQLYGKILRLDVDSAEPYAIPPTNPFVGVPGALEEIWAYGFRNPWRFSFDRATGELYIADVGENSWEEVDLQPAASPGGENYGWRRMEGNHCFKPQVGCDDGTLTLPLIEYPHVPDCAVIGGYSYRGHGFPLLDGVYFYGDYCTGKVWGAYRDPAGSLVNPLLTQSGFNIGSFGEDEAGDVYVSDLRSKSLYRIRDLRPFCDVEVSKDTYVDGDVVTATVLRLVNLSNQAVTVSLKSRVIPPSGPPIRVANNPALPLPPGSDRNVGPRGLFTVDANSPRGAYSLNCQFFDPVTQELLAQDSVPFVVQ